MKFFVSYSRSVQEPVRAIITALRDDGEEVWWDQDLRAGQDWWATILDNIEQCQVCLFFVSEKSVQSPYCMEELRYALARNRLVLPYVMDVVAYTLPPEIMKGRIQYETYNGIPDHIRERIRITTGGVKWDQYKDRYRARPPEPNTGTSDLMDRLDKAISLANEGYFDEAILGFKDVSNNDYSEYGVFCHDWIDKINRYKDIAKLADRTAMRQLAKPKWEKFVEQYGGEFDPLGVEGKFLPAVQLKILTAEGYLEQGKKRPTEEYDLKIVDYTEAIRLNPRLTEAYLRRAGNYNAKEDYDRALADYDEALSLEPDSFLAFNGRGLIHASLMQHNQAIADYSEAIRLAPQFADIYYNRGISYSSIGHYDQAITDYSEVIRLNPPFANAYNNRGNNYKLKGDYDHTMADYDRAIADYEQALRLDPRHPIAKTNLKKAQEAKAR